MTTSSLWGLHRRLPLIWRPWRLNGQLCELYWTLYAEVVYVPMFGSLCYGGGAGGGARSAGWAGMSLRAAWGTGVGGVSSF